MKGVEVDSKLDEGIPLNVAATPPQHVGVLGIFFLRCKGFWTRVRVIPTLAGLVIVLVAFGLTVETQLITGTPPTVGTQLMADTDTPTSSVLSETEVCSPRVLNVSEIDYHSGHRFYATLKEMGPPTKPLTFRGVHTKLCEEKKRKDMKFQYCLPIDGRKDIPYCTASDRTDLLSVSSPKSVCFASVLHLLLVDVYDELKAAGNTPLVIFGSLLGAVRNGSMIPFTEDTDIGYDDKTMKPQELQEKLWQKGYHMFHKNIWRVCVAPTHPLASHLYDPTLPLTTTFGGPYLDLYKMKKLKSGKWTIESFAQGRKIPKKVIEPFSTVTINGMPYDTVHMPDFFLRVAYGPNYMTPKPRKKRLPPSIKAIIKAIKWRQALQRQQRRKQSN